MPTPARSAGPTVQVEGIKELQAALRDADRDLPKRLRIANMKAAEVSAVAARGLAQGASRMAAKAADSIRASAEQRAAKLTFGGAKYPFAFGANWGAHHDQQRSTSRGPVTGWNQFPDFQKHDRFIYRAIEATTPEPFMSGYEQQMDALLADIEHSHQVKFSRPTIGH